MPRLKIRHESTYAYDRPVRFGAWRLLMRPLDTHATRLIEATLEAPAGRIKWSYDAYGNSVCHLYPSAEADRLSVVNNLVVERYPSLLARADVDNPRSSIPIIYSLADRTILEPFIAAATDDRDPDYLEWVRAHAPSAAEPAVDFLRRLNGEIHQRFAYRIRNEPGAQSPSQTVALGSGTCRDFAWLMIETVRRLGFAARFATGYIHSPGSTVRGSGATHAWCEVFLPDIGWTEFDPTNGLVESSSLIRVAATRTWSEASPMNGVIYGDAACILTVAVDVDLIEPNDAVSPRTAVVA